MRRIIRIIIQTMITKTTTERRLTIERSGIYLISLLLTSSLFFFWFEEFGIITLIVLLIVGISGKSKHLIVHLQAALRMERRWFNFSTVTPRNNKTKRNLYIFFFHHTQIQFTIASPQIHPLFLYRKRHIENKVNFILSTSLNVFYNSFV